VKPVSAFAQKLSASRAPSPHTSMFLRMLVRAAVLRRGRAAAALFAMVVAAAVATAVLNLYADVQAKLRSEFRNYGANIIVAGKHSSSLPAGALPQVESVLSGRGIAAPFALVVAHTSQANRLSLRARTSRVCSSSTTGGRSLTGPPPRIRL